MSYYINLDANIPIYTQEEKIWKNDDWKLF